jgi:hypothetical protein
MPSHEFLKGRIWFLIGNRTDFASMAKFSQCAGNGAKFLIFFDSVFRGIHFIFSFVHSVDDKAKKKTQKAEVLCVSAKGSKAIFFCTAK